MLWWAERHRQASLPIVWIGAIVFQGLLLLTAPTLSDDVYRYLWDGHIANHDVSPYAHPIDAPELDELEVPIRALTNHGWMASPYLPAAQWLVRAVTWLLPLHARSMQLVTILDQPCSRAVDCCPPGNCRVTPFPCCHLSLEPSSRGRDGARCTSGRVDDAADTTWLPGPPWFNGRRASHGQRQILAILLPWMSPVALGMATMTKIIPMLALPVFYWIWQKRWASVAIYAVTVAVVLIPAGMRTGWGLTGPLDGRGLFGALRIYGDQWNYNSGLFHWLEVWLGVTGLGALA